MSEDENVAITSGMLFPEVPVVPDEQWYAAEELLPQIRRLYEDCSLTAKGDFPLTVEFATIFHNAAWYCYVKRSGADSSRCCLDEAQNYAQFAQHVYSSVPITAGDDEWSVKTYHVADAANRVGIILLALGKLDEALEYIRRAFDMRLCGPSGEFCDEVAQSENNLAAVKSAKGLFREAFEHIGHALKTRRALFDSEVLATGGSFDADSGAQKTTGEHLLTTLNNMVVICDALADVDGAICYGFQAKALAERLFGGINIYVATSCANLALASCTKKEFDEAKRLSLQAVEISDVLFHGKTTELLILSLMTLASACRGQGNVDEGFEYMKLSWEKCEKFYETLPMHPTRASVMDRMAIFYYETAQYGLALKMARDAQAIYDTLGICGPGVDGLKRNMPKFVAAASELCK